MSGRELDLSNLSLGDVQNVLRVLRTERDRIIGNRMLMTERLNTMGDGERHLLEAEILLATNEIHSLTTIISKLWAIVAGIKHGG